MIEHAEIKNRLLRTLSDDDFRRLIRSAKLVDLKRGEVLYEAEAVLDTVWFPETGLISIMSVMLSGSMIETSVVGQEGGLGFIEASGGRVMFSRAIVQVPGRFLGIPVAAYRAAFEASSSLRQIVQDHIELLVTEARQAMACIALHQVEQRLAWWLLEAQDRIGGAAELPLTQEFLAVMLAVRRATVTSHAAKLQKEGLIHYSRGRITVLNRPGLERRACECYATTQHFRRRIERGSSPKSIGRRAAH
jgi:CRP-like cAMP-binding protein